MTFQGQQIIALGLLGSEIGGNTVGMARLDKFDGSRDKSTLNVFLVVWDGMENRRGGGAQWKEAPVIFLWRGPHFLRGSAKSEFLLADSAGLADGLTGCREIRQLAKWDLWKVNQPTTSTARILEPNKTLPSAATIGSIPLETLSELQAQTPMGAPLDR